MIPSLHPSISPDPTADAADPIVMCAADNAYVIPLAVTLTSAAKHLPAGCRMLVYLIDTGIDELNWIGLKESLSLAPVDIIHVPVDVERLRHLKTSHHISHTAFVRLLAAEWLPSNIDRVIYLDSDLLFRDDLSKIWNVDLGNEILAAVPDIACPFIDARHAQCNFRRSSPFLATLAPVRNWRKLGLDPAAPYFNSGVMLIDLKTWRRERLGDQFLRCLADNERHVWCWDQYALNVVLAERWRTLPVRWNQGTHLFEYPSAEQSPVGLAEYREMFDDPAVIHFTTEFKPWRHGSRHPQRDLYFQALQETAWRDWLPTKTDTSLRQAWQTVALAIHKRTTIAMRKLNALLDRSSQATTPHRVFDAVELPATEVRNPVPSTR